MAKDKAEQFEVQEEHGEPSENLIADQREKEVHCWEFEKINPRCSEIYEKHR